jgi:hypothetical protein
MNPSPLQHSIASEIRQDFERPVLRRPIQIALKDKQSPGYAAAVKAVAVPKGPLLAIPHSAWEALCAKWGNVGTDESLNQQHPICAHGRRLLAELAIGNEVLVSDAERQARAETCAKCVWNWKGTCRKAECRMSSNTAVIVKYATEVCPLGKWPLRAAAPRKNVLVSDTDRAARQAICAKCEFQSAGACKKTSPDSTPFTSILSQYVTNDCPAGKWPPPTPNQAG